MEHMFVAIVRKNKEVIKMVTKEDCMERGMVYVEPHPDGKGGYTRGYCRKKKSEKEKHHELNE